MTGPLRISIALCSCDGERFLPAQLDSIRGQDRPPDEVVICDDASGDGTWDIVEQFRRDAPFPVRAVRNGRRLGVAKNFERAIGLCAGDVIALSDQDDVWMSYKLSRLGGIFAGDPSVGAVFTDGEVVDAELHPLGYRLSRAHRPNRYQLKCLRKGYAFGALLNRNLATGATMAFRSRFRSLLLPIPEEWVHDGWIALLIAAVSKVEGVPEPLILYRRHAAQQIGAERKGFSDRVGTAKGIAAEDYLWMGERFGEILERLRSAGGVSPEILRDVEGKIAHLAFRAGRSAGGTGPLPVAKELLAIRYNRYSEGWKSALKDLAGAGRGGR